MTHQLAIAPDVLFQEVNGELVLLDLEGEVYFGLDATGTRIWQLLSEGRSVPELLDALETEYDVERAVLEADVDELITQLIEAGLVTQRA